MCSFTMTPLIIHMLFEMFLACKKKKKNNLPVVFVSSIKFLQENFGLVFLPIKCVDFVTFKNPCDGSPSKAFPLKENI